MSFPAFPAFRPITYADRHAFEAYTAGFPPYSDFNFTSLWAWDVNETVMLSTLNDNLVVLFNDYMSDRHYLSYIGRNALGQTAAELIRYSEPSGLGGMLKYVPEEVATGLNAPGYVATVDSGNCDYVLETAVLANLIERPRRSSPARALGTFVQRYPKTQTRVSSIGEMDVRGARDLFSRWAATKQLTGDHLTEFKALERFFRLDEDTIAVLSIHDGDLLIGFQTVERLCNAFAMTDFVKGDTHYRGVYPAMMWEAGKFLQRQHIEHLNFQVDLGHQNLRTHKAHLGPAKLLKSFVVERTDGAVSLEDASAAAH